MKNLDDFLYRIELGFSNPQNLLSCLKDAAEFIKILSGALEFYRMKDIQTLDEWKRNNPNHTQLTCRRLEDFSVADMVFNRISQLLKEMS